MKDSCTKLAPKADHVVDTGLTRLLCFVLCFAGFSLSWSIWSPGFMSPDSHHQWNQVLSGNYADDHPTIMVLLWRILHIFHEGPTGCCSYI